jgi:adenylate cyclase
MASGHLSVPDVSSAFPSSVTALAVLPFNNMSADVDNEYFSDGVTEEIISKLARIKNLRVAARTSVTRFKRTTRDAKEIGEELGVRYLLEGSVRKAGERVRITAQLIEATSGFHIWAEDYEGELHDVFRIQEQTALQIAEALNLQLTPQEQSAVQHRHTENAQAYDAYLRGQALIHDFADPRKLAAAKRHFERAFELDSSYAPALAGLASVETLTYRNIDSDESRLDRAAQLAKKALALNPGLSRANVAIGETLAARYDYAGAAHMFREALRVEPNDPWTWDVLSWVLGYQRPPDVQGAEQAAREALRLEPQFSHAYYHLGRALLLQQRVDEATEAFEHILELSPDAGIAHFGLAQAYLSRGQFDNALAESMKGAFGGAVGHFLRCAIHAARGNREDALVELESALDQGFRDFTALDTNPHLESLRSEPRFQQLVRRYRASAFRNEPH